MNKVPEHMLSKYSVCKEDNGSYAILELFGVPVPKAVLPGLQRRDIVKIMDDCAKWLDEEESGGRPSGSAGDEK